MTMTATPFDSDHTDDARRLIIRLKPNEPARQEGVKAIWGSNPRFSDGVSYRFIRSEGKTFPSHRCLVPASEFQMTVGDQRYRVTRDDGNFFYLAGIWEPAIDAWPVAFRIITVAANPEVSRYQERHGAIIERRQAMQWLNHSIAETDLLVTPPSRTFVVAEIGGARAIQTELAL